MNKPLTITMLSDSPTIPTGYSNQSKLLARYLRSKGHTIHYLGNSYNGAPIKHLELADGTVFDYNIYGEMIHSYFMNTISEHLKTTKSDIFYILLDTFMLMPNPMNGMLLDKDLAPARSLFWFPSDGGKFPAGCERVLKKVDMPVAMSKFAQKQVKDYHNINTEYIPHGTEPDRFFKMPEEQRNQLRMAWGFHDKFVVGVVARNQPRKFLDRTLRTIALLKDRLPNVILFLHLDPNDAAQAFNLTDMIRQLGIENRVVFSGMKAHAGWPWNKMNEVYNLMDCFFLSTSGEGFGIPTIEAMSAEVPVIATDYTTTQELVKDHNAGLGVNLVGTEEVDLMKEDLRGYDMRVLNGTIPGSWNVDRGLCDIKDAANKILLLASNPQMRIEMGKNGRKAVLEKYDFNTHVGPKWEELFYKLLEQ